MASPEERDELVNNAGFYKTLLAIAYGFVHRFEDAKDVVQDAFLDLLKMSVENLRPVALLQPFMKQVVRNKASRLFSKESEIKKLPIGEAESTLSIEPVFSKIEWKEVRTAFYAAFTEETDRIIFEMRLCDGYSYEETAQAVGKTEGAVRKRIMVFRNWRQNNFER